MKKEKQVKILPKQVLRVFVPNRGGLHVNLLSNYNIHDKEIDANLTFYLLNKSKKKKIVSLNMDQYGFYIETESYNKKEKYYEG